jgi:SulP family sulfate permease
MLDRMPILKWLPGYDKSWLRTDLLAGLTVVALLIPEGMAYAQIAGVPPQAAFYAAPVGLLAFAVFGSSRQLVVAVSAAIASMSFATVSLVATPNTGEFIVLTAALALLAGGIAVVAGLLKLGRVAQFFSESVMIGFISGLALVIAVKQVPKVLGIEGGHGNFWERLYDVFSHLTETQGLTLLVGATSIVVLVALEHYFEQIPAALVALVLGIVVSALFKLETHGVEIVGDIPAGLVAPQWPSIGWHEWGLLLPGAMGLALVGFAEAIGPSRAFASEHGYEIDADQEFIGLGVANVGAGMFQGFPIGSSLSKSAANDRAGAHTQLSGIFAAAVTALVALFFTGLFRQLPEAVLGAIVIVAVSGMVKLAGLRRLLRVRRVDFVLAAVALLAVLTFETLQALFVAVVVSLFALVWRTSLPRLAVLGRVPDGLEFSDVRRHPENVVAPGLLMVRPENEMFFANAAGLREVIMAEVTANSSPVTAVLIDLSATTDLDVPAADALEELHDQLSRRDIRLMLTHVITPVRETLDRATSGQPKLSDVIYESPVAALVDHLSATGNAAAIDALRDGAEATVRRVSEGPA